MIKLPFDERAAMQGEPLPPNMSSEASCLYVSLRYIYRIYRSGAISRESASEEKKKLIAQYELEAKQRELDDKCRVKYLNISDAAIRYKKDRTIENADKLYFALYGVEP